MRVVDLAERTELDALMPPLSVNVGDYYQHRRSVLAFGLADTYRMLELPIDYQRIRSATFEELKGMARSGKREFQRRLKSR
jgi:hypothetical protein